MAQGGEVVPSLIVRTDESVLHKIDLNRNLDESSLYTTMRPIPAVYSRLNRPGYQLRKALPAIESTDKKYDHEKEESSTTKRCRPSLILAVVAIVIFAILIAVSIVVLSEVFRLRSDVSALQKAKSNMDATSFSEITGNLTHLSRNVMKLEDTIDQHLADGIHMNIARLDSLSSSTSADLTRLSNKLSNNLTAIFSDIQAINQIIGKLSETSERNEMSFASIASVAVSISNSFQETYSSCSALPPSFPSGYYSLRTSNSSAVRVYCDMTRSCSGITGGWMRVAELDMADNTAQCPRGSTEMTYSNLRTCIQSSQSSTCSEDIDFDTKQMPYTDICGMIRGYQLGSPDGFGDTHRPINPTSADGNYVDGVSLTHGINHSQHIWTFAAGNCPCSEDRPTFLENDFFCDGVPFQECSGFCGVILWDGVGCETRNSPWFHKHLPQPTTDAIQMRVCRDQPRDDEDVAIDIIEIYVQ